ncbi:MAG: hypothetical protein ACKN9T_09345 [Candidatus Methylumidiphilus sp.]
MGGFLFVKTTTEPDRVETSLEVFQKKGLALDRKLIRDGFIVWRFHKRIQTQEHILELPNGDFVLYTGTLLYCGKVGLPALTQLHEDFIAGKTLETGLSGHYAVLLYAHGKLLVFSDYAGYYPVYGDINQTLLSNSYLAVARLAGAGKLGVQAFYEYLLFGLLASDDTLLDEVKILNSKYFWNILPNVHATPRAPHYPPFAANASFSEIVERVAGDLGNYFRTLAENFTAPIGSALSSGYDSRLMLAALRHLGHTPYLHVYGKPNSDDVVVAKAISVGENIPVEHVDKSTFPKISPDAFAAIIEEQAYFFDCIKPVGIIDDGTDLSSRMHRASKASLQLNGGGGEIYREIWNLSDRNIGLQDFLRMRFDRGVYPFCRGPFDLDTIFANFTQKAQNIVGIERDWISRREAETLEPFLRNLFAAPNNAANNQISYSLLPFMDPSLFIPSFDIPIKHKYCGEFQARLIQFLAPTLAKYPSHYGINFSDPIPPRYRLLRLIERNIPLKIRLLKRSKISLAGPRPYYFADDYLSQVFDLSNLKVAEYVDIDKIDNPEILSRALSVELLLSHL